MGTHLSFLLLLLSLTLSIHAHGGSQKSSRVPADQPESDHAAGGDIGDTSSQTDGHGDHKEASVYDKMAGSLQDLTSRVTSLVFSWSSSSDEYRDTGLDEAEEHDPHFDYSAHHVSSDTGEAAGVQNSRTSPGSSGNIHNNKIIKNSNFQQVERKDVQGYKEDDHGPKKGYHGVSEPSQHDYKLDSHPASDLIHSTLQGSEQGEVIRENNLAAGNAEHFSISRKLLWLNLFRSGNFFFKLIFFI